jgi:hypothetical protein
MEGAIRRFISMPASLPDPGVTLLLVHLGPHRPKGSKLGQNIVEKIHDKSQQSPQISKAVLLTAGLG